MPKFAIYDPSEQGINFTGRSQGYTSAGEVIGKSLKGFAQTASLFLENKDKEEKNALLKAADASANDILGGVPSDVNPYGVQRVEDDRPGRLEDIPVGLQTGLDNFQRYAKAYAKGGNTDLDIYGKMVAAAKQLKAKFPGHTDDVDNIIMSALNSKPANVIRKELNSLLDAEARKQAEGADSTEKYYRQWAGAEGNAKYISQSGYDIRTLDFSNENQMRTVQNHVMQMQAEDLKTAQTKNKLELNAAVGTNQAKEYKTAAAEEIGHKIDQSLSAGSKEFDAFMKSKTDATAKNSPGGELITPEEQQVISTQFGAVSSALRLQAQGLVNGPFYLKGLPNKADREDVLSAVDERLKVYQDMLDNKMFGLFNGVKNQIDGKYAQNELKALNGELGDYTKIILQAQKMGIPMESIDAALTQMYGDAGLADVKLKAARQLVTTAVAGGSATNLGQTLETSQKDGLTDPQFYRKTLEDMSFILTDPNQDPKVVDNAAKAIYQPQSTDKLLKQFSGKSQKQVFARLTDPRIFERLKGTENYKLAEDWAKNQFVQLNKANIDAVIENQDVIGEGVGVIFDPKTSTFKVSIDPSAFMSGPTNPFTNSPGNPEGLPEMGPEFARAEKLKTALVSMNADLARIHGIVEGGQSGLDPSEETKLLLHLGGMYKLPKDKMDMIMSTPEGEAKPAASKEPTARSIVGASRPDVTSADDFLASISTKSKSAITGLDDNFSTSLASFIQSAPAEIRDKLGVFSAKRSKEHQKELWDAALKKYGSPEAARKWVAPPGKSRHEQGLAVDLSYDGKSLAKAPADVVRWIHDHADEHGLFFPMSWENWHIELKQ